MLAMFIAHSSQKLSLKVFLMSFYSSELGARQAFAPCRVLPLKSSTMSTKGGHMQRKLSSPPKTLPWDGLRQAISTWLSTSSS